MRLKHAFSVFIDNFSTTYKLLLYKILVTAIVFGLACAVIIPSVNAVLSTAQYAELSTAFREFFDKLTKFEVAELHDKFLNLNTALGNFKTSLGEKGWLFAVDVICLIIVALVHFFLTAIGDYAMGAALNYRMTLRAEPSFVIGLLKDIKKACLYAVIYAPLTMAYYLVSLTTVWAIVFVVLGGTSVLFQLFLTSVLLNAVISLKITLTADWLPSLICSHKNNRKALAYSLNLKGKPFGQTFSVVTVLVLIIIVVNISVPLLTFGAGLLLTMPASSLIIGSYHFTNYFDYNGLKYFVDEYTIIGPKKEIQISRSDFFKGDDDRRF